MEQHSVPSRLVSSRQTHHHAVARVLHSRERQFCRPLGHEEQRAAGELGQSLPVGEQRGLAERIGKVTHAVAMFRYAAPHLLHRSHVNRHVVDAAVCVVFSSRNKSFRDRKEGGMKGRRAGEDE